MPSNTARAAATGMPKINRRAVLMGSGMALAAPAAGVAIEVTKAHSASSQVAELIEAHKKAAATYAAACAAFNALEAQSGRAQSPRWKAPRNGRTYWLLGRDFGPFHDSAAAAAAFDAKIAKQSLQWWGDMPVIMDGRDVRANLERTNLRNVDQLQAMKAEVVADLERQEVAYEASGLPAADRRTEEALAAADAALLDLLAVPCFTAADVALKMAYLRDGAWPIHGCEPTTREIEAFYQSLLTVEA